MAVQLHQNNKNSIESIAKRFGFSRRTLYRQLQQHQANLASEQQTSDSLLSGSLFVLKGDADTDIHIET
jgi:transposase-like protein